MKPSWTIARLLREYPQCKKVLTDYDLDPKVITALTISAVANEIEEDIDDFMAELDDAANSLSEYDSDVEEDDIDTVDDDEYEEGAAEEEEEAEETPPAADDDTFPEVDGDGAPDEEEDDADDDDAEDDDAEDDAGDEGAPGADDDD